MSEKKYGLSIIDQEGEIVVDINIMPTFAIKLLGELLTDSLTNDTEDEEEEEIEEEAPPQTPKKRASRKTTTCSDCGNEGHTKRTCPNQGEVKKGESMGSELSEPTRATVDGDISNEEKIKNLVDAGRTDTEIFNLLHDHMTEGQIREAINSAR